MQLVTYLMSGKPHIPYLVASLSSLRRHWNGPVRVYAYPESYDMVCQISKDERLGGVVPFCWEPVYNGKNGQFLNKIVMMRQLKDVEAALYLDADTLIAGDLSMLFDTAIAKGCCVTQFNDWVSNSGIPRKRVERLLGRTGINQRAVKEALAFKLPSPNGGVFSARPDSSVLMVWERWTRLVLDLFIADETVLHAIVADNWSSYGNLGMLRGGEFNCSPKYRPSTLRPEDVRIWHFHGDSNVRQNKCPRGVALWWAEYRQCREQNIGGVMEIEKECGNKYLDKLLSTPEDCCFLCRGPKDEHARNCPLFND